MRLNDIELRITRYGDPESNEHVPTFEIVAWEPNPYFGKEDDFEKVNEYQYRTKEPVNGHYFHHHVSCFERKETCYTIALIKNGIVDFIGDRAIELNNEQRYKDFLFLLRKCVSKSLRWKNKKQKQQ